MQIKTLILGLFCVLTHTTLVSDNSFRFFDLNVLAQQEDELPRFLRQQSDWAYEKMEELSLEEKIAQSMMVATWPNQGTRHQAEIDSVITHYKIGGLIYFQGDWENTKESIGHVQSVTSLPLLIGMDAEWGTAMRLWQRERFPYQLTLGAANKPKQTRVLAESMGEELNELGVHLNFSPVLDVNTNPDNPVIGFRSFGESAMVVSNLGNEMIRGMESRNVLTCMKHFPGHGDTDVDSHYDLPVVNRTLQQLDIEDWAPFRMGRLAGVSSIMMAHLNVPALDDSETPTSLSRKVIQEYVRGKLKFSGLIISDALNMNAVSERYGAVEVVAKAYEAGNDILLYPSEIKASISAISEKIKAGEIEMEEVDERCLKILKAKYHAIIKEKNHKKVDQRTLDFAKMHVYEQAITVIKNDNALPVKNPTGKIACVSVGTGDTGFSNRLKTYTDADHFHAYSAHEVERRLLDTLASYDVVLLNLYATSMLPSNGFNYPKGWKSLFSNVNASSDWVVTFFGNPYVAKEKSDFEKVDAVILAYENAFWAQERVAQLIFGSWRAKTGLPVALSSDFPFGFSADVPKASRIKYTVPEELGISRKKLKEIDSVAINGIREEAYPGCQIVAAKDGKLFYHKSFGYQTYDSLLPITNETIYDLASITKIAASTISLMKLEDEGRFNLDTQLKDYLPELTADSPHKFIRLKDMMAHQAGLTPWIPFYMKTVKDGKPIERLYSKERTPEKSKVVTDSLFLLDTYEDTMYARILASPIRSGNKYRYSDVGYYYIKKIIEKIHPKGIVDYAFQNFYHPMRLKSMRYHPLDHFERDRIAPTERDSYFRNQLVHGHVHDMGAAMMDGVGGHAGLFSNALDLASLMQMVLNKGTYGGVSYLSPEVVERYTSCQFCPRNRRGAGFDRPVDDLNGGPTCKLVSHKSFGHSGFTGTQAWADPVNGINYVFLSNRVYPDGENWKLVKMNIRTEIQRLIYEAIQQAEM